MIRAHFPRLSRAVTLFIVATLLVSAVGLAGSVPAASDGPAAEQGPVEFTALWSGDNHVEVVFEDSIATDDYAFAIVDGSGKTVADDDDINEGFTNGSIGRVVFDLGSTDLSGDAVLRVERDNDTWEFPITTTATFVQEGFNNDGEIHPGETLALVDIYGNDTYYEIRTETGELVTNGTLGTHSYTTAVDTQGWEENATYVVQFGKMSVIRKITVTPANDASPEDATEKRSPEEAAEEQSVSSADLQMHNPSLSDANVTVDETVIVTATFENAGNASGSFTAWVADGDLNRLSDRTITGVGVDETRQVRVSVTFDRAGTYTVLLSGRPVGQVTVHNPERAWFDDRYPNLTYDIWESFLGDEASNAGTTTDEEAD